ncbi:MAG: methyltransferase domain-containing protein [Flavobacteriales bacterium]|nr:methyltransferase domain-containing protein [Flavobacteriales bacterium]
MDLSKEFWSKRYTEDKTGWDLGTISEPLKKYFDQLTNKELKILIPGCGNGHEAEYLFKKGFNNVHLLDFAKEPLDNFEKRVPEFPAEKLHNEDFFKHKEEYDLIVEQTLFCAIDPKLRMNYARKAKELLGDEGRLIGLLFEMDSNDHPPFGGDRVEYLNYFNSFFDEVKIDSCYNSIKPREGRELFIIAK